MISIAIDGPAGSGKTTMAKMLSKKLDFCYLNTGAMYRALGMFCYFNNKDCTNPIDAEWVCKNANLELKFINSEQHTIINGEDYNKHLTEYIASKNASDISKHVSVREKCVKIQRDFSLNNNVVVEGRDIGSVVLPNADFKFFFELAPEIRAERRLKQFIENGTDLTGVTYETILADIKQRDLQDSTRSNSPLKKMPDSITVDCSVEMGEEVDFMLNIIYKKFPELKR